MPRSISFLLLCLLFSLMAFAQKAQKAQLHSPGELFQILDKSKIVYEFGLMDSTFPCVDRSEVLNDNNRYPSKARDGHNGFATYELTKKEEALLDEGEALFTNGNYEGARTKYIALTKLRPDYAPAFTYVGQTYEKSEQYSEAIKWEEQAVQANFYDYLAHYFLADNYAAIGNHKRAADEIIMASILNRNNKNIRRAMDRIMPAAGYRHRQWCFEPQVLLYRKGDMNVTMNTNPGWMGWAIAKAVWKFEPGYREAAGGAPQGQYNMAEDRECLMCLAFALHIDSSRSWKSDPALTTLNKSVENKMFEEYLTYELVLPKFPFSVYQLSRDQLEDLRKYVLAVRIQ